MFYLAPISTDDLNRRYRTNMLVGAASNKVVGVCSALATSSTYAVIVTAFLPGRITQSWRFALHRSRGSCVAVIPVIGKGLLKRVLAGIGYWLFAARFVRPADRVILYNFFPEYIPAAFHLWATGNPAIIDVEDAPRHDEAGPRGWVNRVSFKVLRRFCRARYLVASTGIVDALGLPASLVVHGIAELAQRPAPPFAATRVRVLYGGSIIEETGLHLFCAAARFLAARHPDLPLDFVVTGFFDVELFRALKREIEGASSIRVEVRDGLDMTGYRALAAGCDVGLCLKLPDTSMGKTTFPSKIIEYLGLGLLVVTTSVSDVERFLDDRCAVVLKTAGAEELAARLEAVVADRAGSAERAGRGVAVAADLFTRQGFGRKAVDFVFG